MSFRSDGAGLPRSHPRWGCSGSPMRIYAKRKEESGSESVAGVSVVLGRRLRGDSIAPLRDGQVVWTFKDKPPPWLVPGASGRGKSETLLSIEYQLARDTDWPVFYLDAKGDRETAERHLGLQRDVGRNPCVFPYTRFDGFRGDWKAIVNRLLHVIEYDGPSWFRDVAKTTLQTACRAGNGPPRSSAELLRRLSKTTLSSISGGSASSALTEERIDEVRVRYEAFFGQIGTALDGDLAWEDADWYFLLDSIGEEEDAASLASYLTADFGQYFKDESRKPREQNCVFVIDEFSAVAERSRVAKLVEQARAYGALLLLAPQTEVGMGSASQAGRVLGSTEVTVVHGMKEPERIAALAGERERLAATQYFDEGRVTGKGHVATEVCPRLPADWVMGLKPGEVWVILGNRAMKVAIARAPQIYADLPTPEDVELPLWKKFITGTAAKTLGAMKEEASVGQ